MPPTPPHDPLPPNTTPPLIEPAPKKPRSGSGPIVGIIIIVFLLIIGGLYFWGAQLNRSAENPLPLIPGDPINS